jgi:predicted anti-sigma-YlaC factor YlaD
MAFDPALHASDEELEQFSVGQLAGKARARLEQHLLFCEACRVRLDEQMAYNDAMRHAAAEWRSSHPLVKRRAAARRESPTK